MALPNSPTQFVKEWMGGRTNKELAEFFDVAPSTIYLWAHALRREGVNLPARPQTGRKSLNVTKLNNLIERLK